MPVISITRLRVRSWRYLPGFLWYALRSAQQAKKAAGNLAVQLLKDKSRAFWTATAWKDDAAMKSFMLASPHGIAMRKLLEWCDEAALVRWSQDAPDLPSWSEASRRLQSEGRRSKVNHPSSAHMAHKFPEPRVSRAGLRLK